MSKQEARRWALEFFAKRSCNWASIIIATEILSEYIMDGSFPPFDDDGGIDIQKWLDDATRDAPDASNEEVAHVVHS